MTLRAVFSRVQEAIEPADVLPPGAIRSDGVDVRPPRRSDWFLAGLMAAMGLAEPALSDVAWPVAAGLTSLVCASVVPWRRVHAIAAPLVAFGAVAGSALVNRLYGTSDVILLATELATLVLIYSACRWGPTGRLVPLGGSALALLFLALIIGEDPGTPLDVGLELLPWVVLIGVAAAMRYRSSLAEERVTQGRLAERNELARELHDVVAHHVSAISVQAQAAQAVADDDPAAVVRALASIEETAGTTLTEMRRMVGILRNDGRRPVAASDGLRALAGREESPTVKVSGAVDLDDYVAPVAAALLRIGQEATTNARRHAPGATFVEITVTRRENDVHIEVINDGGAPTRWATGLGLVGMQERVAALGGTIVLGPRPRTGWSVLATLPLEP